MRLALRSRTLAPISLVVWLMSPKRTWSSWLPVSGLVAVVSGCAPLLAGTQAPTPAAVSHANKRVFIKLLLIPASPAQRYVAIR